MMFLMYAREAYAEVLARGMLPFTCVGIWTVLCVHGQQATYKQYSSLSVAHAKRELHF